MEMRAVWAGREALVRLKSWCDTNRIGTERRLARERLLFLSQLTC